MDSIRPAEEVKKEIIKRYNAEPEGWQISVGRSSDRYYTVIASHGSDRWIIKEQPLSPFDSVGCGVLQAIEEGEKSLRLSHYPFGFRPLTESQAKTIIGAMEGERNLDKLFRKVLRTKPLPVDEIRAPAAIQGPIVYSNNMLQLLSERQRELDKMLGEELEKQLVRKYSYRMGMYL